MEERKGLWLAAISSFFFSLCSLLAKLSGLPPGQLSWFGFFGVTVLSAPWALTRLEDNSISRQTIGLILLRAVAGTIFFVSSYSAVEMIPIGDASVIFYTAPVFTVILARVFLGEPCTLCSVFQIIMIIIGVTLVTQPPFIFSSSENIPENYFMGVLTALLASVSEAIGNIGLRKLRSVHCSEIMFYHGLISLWLNTALLFFIDLRSITWNNMLLLVILLVASALEQLLMTIALSLEHAGPVALIQATDIIFGYLYQILFFGEVLNYISFAGASIVAVMVFYMANGKGPSQSTS